jgi:hypothetical protein
MYQRCKKIVYDKTIKRLKTMGVGVVRKISFILLLVVLLSSLVTASQSAGQAPDQASQSEGNWTLLDAPTAPGGIVDELVEAPGSADTLYALLQSCR